MRCVAAFQVFAKASTASVCACSSPRPALCRGLEQSVALPRDSYLQRYYEDVFASLR